MNPFESRAAEYDAWFESHPALFESELRAIRAVLPERRGRWVEIGVGTGRFASRLGIESGIEPAEAMAVLARARGVRVERGVAEHLPLPDRSIGAAFFITTLCFVSDVGRSLAEVHRVLAPGGTLVTAVFPREREIGRQIVSAPSDAFLRLAKPLTLAELRSALAAAGFRIEREVGTLADLGGPERAEEPQEGAARGSFVVVRSTLGGHPDGSGMLS